MNKEMFLQINIDSISQVYSGRDHCCRCGCGGTYTATSFMKDPRSEVNDALVFKRLKRAKRLILAGAEYEIHLNYLNLVTGNDRCLCFYFDELKK